MWFVMNNIKWRLFNVYKHLGVETAQYGVEITFNIIIAFY